MQKVCLTRRSYRDLTTQCLKWSEKSGILSIHKGLTSHQSFSLQMKKTQEELNELVLAYFKLACFLDEVYIGEGVSKSDRKHQIAKAMEEIEDACGDVFISFCTLLRVFTDIKLRNENIEDISSSIVERFKAGLRVDLSELEEKGYDDVYILCFTSSLNLESLWVSSYNKGLTFLLERFYWIGRLFAYLKSDIESIPSQRLKFPPFKSLLLSSYNHICKRRYSSSAIEGCQFIK